jgi:hypothetical protein
VSKVLQENKDLRVLKDRKENRVQRAIKDLKESKDRPDLLGLLGLPAVGRVKVLQKDTRPVFYRLMEQEGMFVFTPVSNRKESDA